MFFRRKNKNSQELVDDDIGKYISDIWYNLLLGKRECYLTERVWEFMVDKEDKKKEGKKHFFVNFDEAKSSASGMKKLPKDVFQFSTSFLHSLDNREKIHKKLRSEVKVISKEVKNQRERLKKMRQCVNEREQLLQLEINRLLMHRLRNVKTNEKIFEWQQEGIKNAINKWVSDDPLEA